MLERVVSDSNFHLLLLLRLRRNLDDIQERLDALEECNYIVYSISFEPLEKCVSLSIG